MNFEFEIGVVAIDVNKVYGLWSTWMRIHIVKSNNNIQISFRFYFAELCPACIACVLCMFLMLLVWWKTSWLLVHFYLFLFRIWCLSKLFIGSYERIASLSLVFNKILDLDPCIWLLSDEFSISVYPLT